MSKYAEGYQAALAEVAEALLENGSAGVRQWLVANLADRELAAGVEALEGDR